MNYSLKMFNDEKFHEEGDLKRQKSLIDLQCVKRIVEN